MRRLRKKTFNEDNKPVGICPYTFRQLPSGIWEISDEKGNVFDQCKDKSQYISQWNRRQRAEQEGVVVKDEELIQVRTPGGKLAHIDKSVKKYVTKRAGGRPIKRPILWNYDPEMAREICEMLAMGETLSAICRIPGYPPATAVYNWKMAHKDFREMFKQALLDRAHSLRDKALDVAAQTSNSSEVPVSKLHIDTLKWAAEKDNPTDFGPSTKQDVVSTQPIQILIDTGIRREEINIDAVVTKQIETPEEEDQDGSDDQAEA